MKESLPHVICDEDMENMRKMSSLNIPNDDLMDELRAIERIAEDKEELHGGREKHEGGRGKKC